jgi:hypothetical protein
MSDETYRITGDALPAIAEQGITGAEIREAFHAPAHSRYDRPINRRMLQRAGLAPSTGRIIDMVMEREDNYSPVWEIFAIKAITHPDAIATFYRETR